MENINGSSGPIAFVIFGVTGDLTKRKLIPALYTLLMSGKIVSPLFIIGFARRDWSDDTLRDLIRTSLGEFAPELSLEAIESSQLLGRVKYIQSTFDDPDGYQRLGSYLKDSGTQNLLFYLATPPENYLEVIRNIGANELNRDFGGWTRIVVEKPYGRDLESADELEREIHQVFTEKQVYRIDHYLGKETVQNILVFRFANGIFEPLWNHKYVDHVQITVSETQGIGTRAGYYESAGVIRDVFQNHLLQLLTLTAMESPVTFTADAVRDEKVKVLQALRPMIGADAINNTYRAQYVSGMVDGKRVVGYKDEAGVRSDSITETYMAARLFVDNWRWAGVPFYLRSGKRLAARATEIAIQFKQAPLSLFNRHDMAGDAPNILVLNIQPDEGITLTFGAKKPGFQNQVLPVMMKFKYAEAFGSEPPEAYVRLLQDCLVGDATLFTRSDEVRAQWTFTDRILSAWRSQNLRNLPVYEAGTWGPPGADEFIGRDGRCWRNPLDEMLANC